MGQCRTSDADVTMGGDYSSCDNTIPTSLFIWNKFYPSHLFASFKCAASYCIASLIFGTLDMYVEYLYALYCSIFG